MSAAVGGDDTRARARVRRGLAAAVSFFAHPVTGASAALYRVALGVFCIYYGASLALNVERYFSEQGALPFRFASRHARWGAFAVSPLDQDWALAVLLAFALLGLLLALGLLSRLSCAALWYLALSIHHRNPEIISAADDLLSVLLFLSIWLPLGQRLSLDARVRARLALATQTASLWSQRLLQLQVAMIYGLTAVAKLQEPVWQEGMALRGFLAMPSYATWPAWHDPWPFMKPLTWGSLAFEVAFPLLVWFRPLRPWLLLGGVAFHVGIDTLMRIPQLSALMLVSYLMFVPDEVAQRWLARLGTVRLRGRG